jgi:hypothetical protein
MVENSKTVCKKVSLRRFHKESVTGSTFGEGFEQVVSYRFLISTGAEIDC